MKLPDFLEWANFNQLRHQMGAELIASYAAPIKMDSVIRYERPCSITRNHHYLSYSFVLALKSVSA